MPLSDSIRLVLIHVCSRNVHRQLSPLTGHLQSSLETLNQRTSHLTEIHEISAAFAEEAQRKSQSESAIDHDDVLMANDDQDVDEVERGLSTPAVDPPAVTRYGHWSNARLNRMIIDWLLRQGHSDAAQSLATSQNIEVSADRSCMQPNYQEAPSDTLRLGLHSL